MLIFLKHGIKSYCKIYILTKNKIHVMICKFNFYIQIMIFIKAALLCIPKYQLNFINIIFTEMHILYSGSLWCSCCLLSHRHPL